MDNKLEDFLNRDDCYFIHYASSGFYSGSSPAPKVSCIVVFNYKKQDGYRFFIKDHLKEHSKEEAERLLLENFKLLFDRFPNISFIHWNMAAEGFGFKAIQKRAKELGVKLPSIPKENLFNLSSYVSYIAEKKLSIKQILWFNSLLYCNDFLDGKTEAEYAKEGRFEKIFKSVNVKVVGLSMLIDEIKKNNLKTENPFPEPNDGLKKEERRALAQKVAESRERMFKEIEEHNRRVLEHNKRVMEQPVYQEVDEGFLFFDSDHPLLSLFANWFINK